MEEQLPVRVLNKDKPCPCTASYRGISEEVAKLSSYVDKTLLVEEFLNSSQITLVLRPRRFGKTTNLSMLREFFSNLNDTATLKKRFEKTLIYSNPLFDQWAGTRPVIFVSFSVGPITTLQ
jgi:Predicted AAA-ATPase